MKNKQKRLVVTVKQNPQKKTQTATAHNFWMHLVSRSRGAGMRLRRRRAREPSGNWPTHTRWAIRCDCVGNWRGNLCGSAAQRGWLCLNGPLIDCSLVFFEPSCAASRASKNAGARKQSVPRNHTLGHLTLSSDWPRGSDDCIEESQLETHLTGGGFKKKTTNEPLAKARPPRCVRNNTEVLTASTLAGRLSRKVCLWSNK